MELRRFIENVLQQMEELKNTQNKSNYLVEELEFELSLTEIEGGEIGVSFLGIGGGVNQGTENTNKVKVKLIPKNSRRKISMTV